MYLFQDWPIERGAAYGGIGVNPVYPQVIYELLHQGKKVPSRIEDTLELHPATIQIYAPQRRLVTAYGRAVNVPFMLAEVLWIMAGRKDVEMLSYYNSNIASYSDNGESFNAAYGHRMKVAFGHDQLYDVIMTLKAAPDSRQATIVLSHPAKDRGFVLEYDLEASEHYYLPHETRDRACNLLAHLMIRDGKLDWMQVLRSNDAAWGMPYNFMQWLHIMEIAAARLGVPMGTYTHIADSLHLYAKHHAEASGIRYFDLYHELQYDHAPTGSLEPEFLRQLMEWEEGARAGAMPLLDLPDVTGATYWQQVAAILASWTLYKSYEDKACLAGLLLPDMDQVLAAATARFYWNKRWCKSENKSFMREQMYDVWSKRVVDWITA